MASETELQKGQLNPAAKPVDAFIQPTNYQVAEPGRLSELPGVRGMDLISTGSKPNVQGFNQAAQLAEALAPFSKALVSTAQTAGLQYASWQAGQGEAEFMAAYRKAQVQVDQQTEVGETNYASASRSIYAKDKQAGMGMWLANPYRQMGAERARSRIAGQEIAWKMAGIEGQMSPEDYEAPDQGFAKLQSLRAGLISQVTEGWGVNENSPGFQKYTAPAIEKASEKSANKLIEDRQKYFDEMKPKQLAALLKNTLFLQLQSGTFEYQGNTYNRSTTPPELYNSALGLKLNYMARDFLSKAGPGGMATKWSKEAYEILSAEADFTDDRDLLNAIGVIRSGEPLRGPDGKQVMGADGRPVYLTWRQLYSKETIDSQIKYEQAGFTNRTARAKDLAQRAAAEMDLVASRFPIGPERQAAGGQKLNEFMAQEQQRLGRPLTPVEQLEIKKAWKETNDLQSELVAETVDPAIEVNYLGALEQKFGTQFNAAAERAQVTRIAAGMAVNDPGRANRFQAAAFNQIEQKEKEVKDFSGYTSARDKVINDNINARLLRNYPAAVPGGIDRRKADREESERRQRFALTGHVNSRIREKEAQLGRKLNDSEVRGVTQQAVDEYGKTDKDALQYLFPGSQAYPDSPSVDPRLTIKPVPLGPDGKPKPAAGAKPISTFSTQELDDIPNRKVVLRQYRTQPVMPLNSLRDVIFDGIDGKRLPVKFERAWRDAGAPNAYEFLMKQLEFYPNYKPEWSPAEMNKLKQQQQASARTERASQTYAALTPTMPTMASMITFGLNTLTGTAPASAATLGGGGGGRPFTGSPDVGNFRKAILQKESGGNYGAVNPDSGALGVGQVMPYNVGPWTQKYLGRRLTPQQFLRDPAAQDAVVNGRFKDMLADQRKAGYPEEQVVRRAAAVWYSGQAKLWSDTRPQYTKGRRYPSIAEYTQAIWDSYRGGR
jgi:hypothetical protein